MKILGFNCAFLLFGYQVACGTRVQPTRLPVGQTKLVSAPTGDATTTLYLNATQVHIYPEGVLTSIVDTFINDGTTTEYMTQHLGTSVSSVYAKIQTTSSREYYRIAPTASQDFNAPLRPTGLIGSSTSIEINGPASTYYTVEEYRTYLDGHYAHLVSSISNVVSDPGQITPTPRFEFQASLNNNAEESIRKSLLSTYGIGSKPQPEVYTRTIGRIYTFGEDLIQNEIENEIEDIAIGTAKHPRQIDPDDLVAIDSEANEVLIDPAKPTQSLPTFTVGSNGELKFPTPEINEVKPVADKKISERQHRFLPQKEITQSTLDSVTYVGFVDFTTTIDDTVVIFRPKNTYKTKTENIFQPKIEPTSTFTSFVKPTFSSSVTNPPEAKIPKSFEFEPPTSKIVQGSNEILKSQTHKNDDVNNNAIKKNGNEDKNDDNIRKHTSGINALKSLLSSSAALRSSVYNPSTRTRYSPTPGNTDNVLVSPTLTTKSEVLPTEGPKIEGGTQPEVDLFPSIESTSDVELVFKTLYTTYTYFTTFFRESTTRVKSRAEVISNVITLTNILKSTDLPSISSSCELDSSCLFASTNAVNIESFSDGFIGRPNTAPVELPRSGEGRKIESVPEKNSLNIDVDAVLRTFYTTYTYFSTVFEDGTSTVSTRTEVYSNVKTENVPLSVISPDSVSILPTSSLTVNPLLETSKSSSAPTISAFPVRRLEVSSIRNRQLQSELTTPETDTTIEEDTTLGISTTEIHVSDPDDTISTTQPVTEADVKDELDEGTTTETPALTEEVTEVSVTETTESTVDIDAEEVGVVPKTLYTTFTYFTTLFKDGTSTVTSNLETVTNVLTDTNIEPSTIEPSVTFFTTFTYWTTSIDGDNTVVTSREETITDILPASVTSDISLKQNSVAGFEKSDDIDITTPIDIVIEQTEFAYPTSSIENDLDSSEEFSASITPTLQSSEGDEETSKIKDYSTPFPLTSSSQNFEDDDSDLTLTSDAFVSDNSASIENEDIQSSSKSLSSVRPSRTRSRVAFSRPGNTFTPVIRPLLGNRKPARIFRQGNFKVSTTVATRTRNSIKPTLIATPASSALNTPLFEQSSRFLASASLLSRGQSRFSSASFQNSGGLTSSINPSSVSERGTASFSPSKAPEPKPSVVISPIRLRRPNPFRARLKELQQERLEKLRDKNEKEKSNEKSLPIPNLTSVPGGNAPIFVSSQRQTITKTPDAKIPSISIPDDIAARRERARERIKSLFSQRRPFGQSRRKRQVPFGAEFGSRTRERQSYVLRRSHSYQPHYFLDNDQSPPSFSQTQPEGNNKLNDDYFFYTDDDLYSSSKISKNYRRQAPSGETSADRKRSRSRSRSRSRFSDSSSASSSTSRTPARTRSRFRDFRIRPTQPPTTTESTRFSRFRPRTFSSDSRSLNSFSSNRNQNLFSSKTRDSALDRFNSKTSSRNNLFSRTKVVDYSDYDYYDYGDTNIQSSNDGVPDFITVTHQVPVATKIPIVEFGRTELRDILSTSPSLQVIAVTALKSTDISNSPVIYANAQTLTPQPGVQDILFEALRATETTSVTFTPTKIRGRRTSFSHILPSTIYNVETVTTQIIEPIDQNLLLNSLLQHLLLGQSPLNQKTSNPNLLNNQQAIQKTTGTELITHTSTYVTTITEEESTVLPITLRGKAITTTIVESSTKVVTATEYSTETIVHSSIAPTQTLPQIVQTQPPVVPGLNQQIASLLPALLGNPLLNNQQNVLQQQQQQQAIQLQQEALLAKQIQEQQQALLLKQQQEALNEQLLAEINLDDFTDEDLANLDIDAVLDAVSRKNSDIVFPKKNLFDNIDPTPVAQPETPKTSLLTIFKSGTKPGEFTSLVSTIFLGDQKRLKRDTLINPSKSNQIIPTEALNLNNFESLGGPRGPLGVQILESGDAFIEPSIIEKGLKTFDQKTIENHFLSP